MSDPLSLAQGTLLLTYYVSEREPVSLISTLLQFPADLMWSWQIPYGYGLRSNTQWQRTLTYTTVTTLYYQNSE